jgi:hypothetical protein
MGAAKLAVLVGIEESVRRPDSSVLKEWHGRFARE